MQNNTERFLCISKIFGSQADIYAEDEMHKVKMKTGRLAEEESSFLQRKKTDFLNTMDEWAFSIENLYEKAYEILKERLATLPPVEKERIEKEIVNKANLGVLFLEKAKEKDVKGMIEALQAPFSKETQLLLYQIADEFFQAKNYENAQAVFFLLTQIDSLSPSYFIGLALAQRNLHKIEEALYSFAAASLLDPEHPIPRYNAAELYLELKQPEDALIECNVLSEVIEKKGLTHLRPALDALKSCISMSKG